MPHQTEQAEPRSTSFFFNLTKLNIYQKAEPVLKYKHVNNLIAVWSWIGPLQNIHNKPKESLTLFL